MAGAGQLHQLALIAGLAAIYKLPNSLFRSGPPQRRPEMTADKHQSLHRNISARFSSWKLGSDESIEDADHAPLTSRLPRVTGCGAMIAALPEQSTPTIRRMQGGSWGPKDSNRKRKSDTADTSRGDEARRGGMRFSKPTHGYRPRGRHVEESVPRKRAQAICCRAALARSAFHALARL
jgi:hypothetical protein